MSQARYLLGIDQGSSGSRALIIDFEGEVRGYGYRALPRLYPQPTWVEQDPEKVITTVHEAIVEALAQADCHPAEIAACGIACQRNTEFAWHKRTKKPLGNAISWQDLRTIPLLDEIDSWADVGEFRRRLGFYPGPYSSALHLAWRMRHDPGFARAVQADEVEVGFSAEWLLQCLGRPNGHEMDASLVQATGLYEYRVGSYWADWLAFLGIPAEILPQPRPTITDFGTLQITDQAGDESFVPVVAMLGDQQAALFGHNCFHPGDAECTHGTASFINVFLGEGAQDQAVLNLYHAWQLPGQGPTYCLEADTTVTGAALRWMRNQAGILENEADIDRLAASVPDSGGVAFVPAFTGLNVPYHDRHARGALIGLSLGTTRAHIARAFLESIGFQLQEILTTIDREAGVRVERLHIGGGLAASDEACRIQADLTGIPIVRPAFQETTARAAALLAGFGTGLFSSTAELPPVPGEMTTFEPRLNPDGREACLARWKRAVEVSRTWRAE
jgi:glycerol kinase